MGIVCPEKRPMPQPWIQAGQGSEQPYLVVGVTAQCKEIVWIIFKSPFRPKLFMILCLCLLPLSHSPEDINPPLVK